MHFLKVSLAVIYLGLLVFDTYTAFACDAVSKTDMSAPMTNDPAPPQQAANTYNDLLNQMQRSQPAQGLTSQ
jgi:hypothetical protein